MPLNLSPTQIAFNARGDGKFNKSFQEQVDFFRQKLSLPSEHYDDIINDAHDRAFIVAGAAKADLLDDFRQAVDKAIAEGKSIQWFRTAFDDIVQQHGWAYNGERDWRTRVIYTTNLRASYAAGRYAQLTDPALLKNRPYWKYLHNDTVAHPRPLHQSWSGMVLRWDDPFWQTHYPPNGYGCRCRVKAVPASEYKGHPAPDDGTHTVIDRRGVAHALPNGVDYGWAYAPGASVRGQLRDFIDTKSATLPPVLGQAFQADVATISKAPVFEPQASTQLCSKWAMDNNLVDHADYGKVDMVVANEMNQSLFEHLQEFPQLRTKQKFIGTAQLQFAWLHADTLAAAEAELLKKGHTLQQARAYAKKYIKKPKVGSNTWLHSWSHPSYSGIAVNEKWAKDLPAFVKALDRDVASQWHPVGCNTVKSAADHEFGHQLDDLLGLSKTAALSDSATGIRKLYQEALQAGMKDQVSEYAGKNLDEFIAECWSEYKNNPTPRYFSAQVARLIKDEYTRQFPA